MQHVYTFTNFMYRLNNYAFKSFNHVHCKALHDSKHELECEEVAVMSFRNLPGGAEGQYSTPEPKF